MSGNNDPVVPPSPLLAHELAHNWAGDLVTCATWSDTWLNEGFASYLENRILEEMRGAERAEYALFADRRTYESYMSQVGEDAATTALHREFAAGDVPDVFTPAAYEKGGLFHIRGAQRASDTRSADGRPVRWAAGGLARALAARLSS